MTTDARLAAALGASAAPARDPRFTLAVMRAAEADRFKVEAMRAMLSWGAIAAAAAILALWLVGWGAVHWDGVQGGILGAGGIFALVAAARLMTQRLVAATSR
ncbi:hypothetical protein [Candidatus Viadribacter manganicus]|uniref:Uncharacterized protein n=1 Tax=Candidatus Viadribacter manganicus TaxID=1759059 RepID=A0A1B1AE29_9PROT|nr:hypothetical protein [Candidatus Viadribacter manganicus]ANP44809.1 hypothetical protein ATE48_02145 [Candidatus Viadribacter manganicus]